MVFSTLFSAGRNLTRGFWRRASSLYRRAVSGFYWLKDSFWDLLKKALKFLSRPGLLSFGFTAGGIAAGSAAAVYQAFAFGAHTPAGGIFACLTSMAMTNLYPLFALVLSVVVAVVVAVIAKKFG